VDDRRREMLRGTPLFGALSDPALDLLISLSKPVTVAEGDCFFREGERGSSAFLLEQGRVAVIRRFLDRDHLLRELAAGDFFGEVALLDFGPRSATIRALAPCAGLEISARALRELSETHMKDFAIVYMNLGREVSRRLRKADERLFRALLERSPAAEGWEQESS
jgi:CRP-like cAMP-binding protein